LVRKNVEPAISQANGGQGNVAAQPGPAAVGPSAANGGTAGKKKKRRRKRRQWKPYYKLNAEERRELEEREEKRAERVRAQRFAHGQPVAPYNTTQFLLRDRELRNGGAPDCGDLDEIVRNIRHHTRSGSYESPGAAGSDSDVDLSSNDSDYSYLEREFDNDWLDEQRQRLETMTKDDLVKEFMDLQKQYESAQRDMRAKRLFYEDQMANLRLENNELRLRQVIATSASSSNLKDQSRPKVDQSTSGRIEDGIGGMKDTTMKSEESTNDMNYSSSPLPLNSDSVAITSAGQ